MQSVISISVLTSDHWSHWWSSVVFFRSCHFRSPHPCHTPHSFISSYFILRLIIIFSLTHKRWRIFYWWWTVTVCAVFVAEVRWPCGWQHMACVSDMETIYRVMPLTAFVIDIVSCFFFPSIMSFHVKDQDVKYQTFFLCEIESSNWNSTYKFVLNASSRLVELAQMCNCFTWIIKMLFMPRFSFSVEIKPNKKSFLVSFYRVG